MAAPLETYPALEQPTVLQVVPEFNSDIYSETDIHIEGARSREAFEHYFDLRKQAVAVEKIDGEALQAVQADTAIFAIEEGFTTLPETLEEREKYYSEFSEGESRHKLLGLVDYLRANHADKVTEEELQATEAFVESTFSMYSDTPKNGEVMDDADGSFAFVVPARMGRKHPDYGQEVEPAIPALRYMPNELRSAMLVGLPPFVIDRYQVNEENRRGYLVFAPVFEDMKDDLDGNGRLLHASRHNINEAVDFAHRRFGVEVVGLGATLPSLTMFGKKITNPNVTTTTGHGGTVDIIRKTVEMVADKRKLKNVGVLGLGSIGMSIAKIMSSEYEDANIHVYDTAEKPMRNIAELNGNFVLGTSEKAVIEDSEVVVSAITSQLKLRSLGVENLNGTVFVDDSQPGSIDPEEAASLGGAAVWVIGRDATGEVATRQEGYDYGTMVDPNTDLFGCEAEAAAIAKYRVELRSRGMPDKVVDNITKKVAINGPVDVGAVRRISALFTKYGLLTSEPQAFGKHIILPVNQ